MYGVCRALRSAGRTELPVIFLKLLAALYCRAQGHRPLPTIERTLSAGDPSRGAVAKDAGVRRTPLRKKETLACVGAAFDRPNGEHVRCVEPDPISALRHFPFNHPWRTLFAGDPSRGSIECGLCSPGGAGGEALNAAAYAGIKPDIDPPVRGAVAKDAGVRRTPLRKKETLACVGAVFDRPNGEHVRCVEPDSIGASRHFPYKGNTLSTLCATSPIRGSIEFRHAFEYLCRY